MATLSEALTIAWSHHQAGRLDLAEEIYRRILAVEPEHAEALQLLGNVLTTRGDLVGAEGCFRRAAGLARGAADAHNNLGTVLKMQGKLAEAVASYRRALELRANFAETHYNLANALKAQGRLDEAIAACRRALDLKPDYVAAHNNLLLALHYHPASTLATLAEAHADFDRRHAAPLRATWRPHANSRDPERPLRLGFVSPDFCRAPVGFFLIRPLENLDPKQAQAVCYFQRTTEDDLTRRLRAASAGWREVQEMSDQHLAEQIRADGIDVLFDLAGHTGGNRLLAFARKPAPIQITWLGYVGTTGLGAMDYLLADRHQVPPEAEPHYTEKILRMPDGYVCYDPPADAPPVGPLPALASGQVTFGSFNNPAKITPQVVAAWAEILRRSAGSRLIVKYFGLDDRLAADRLRRMLADCGVPANQVELSGGAPQAELLKCYNTVDVALDTLPYSGGLTTCEALWMGVPVVTCPGETFAGRHSLSHLSTVGLTETIAGSLDEYAELAVSLAADLTRLADLRAGLRDRVARSPLCDGRRFADNLTEILRAVWRQFATGPIS